MLELLVIIQYQLSKMIEHIDYHINRDVFLKSFHLLSTETQPTGYLHENEWRVKFTTIRMPLQNKRERHEDSKIGIFDLRFDYETAYRLSRAHPGLTFKNDQFSFKWLSSNGNHFFRVLHQIDEYFSAVGFDEFMSKVRGFDSFYQVVKRVFNSHTSMQFQEAQEDILFNEDNNFNNIGVESNVSGKKYIVVNGETRKITKKEVNGTWMAIDWYFRDEEGLLAYLLPFDVSTNSASIIN